MLQGWQVTSTVSIFSGRPINPTDSTDDFSGTGEAQDRWTLVGPASDFRLWKGAAHTLLRRKITPAYSHNALGQRPARRAAAGMHQCRNEPTKQGPGVQWERHSGSGQTRLLHDGGAVIIPPAQGTFGIMSRNDIYGVGFWEWDMSIIKSWQIKERITDSVPRRAL